MFHHHRYGRTLAIIASVSAVWAAVASTAGAARPATPAQKRAMSRAPGLLNQGSGWLGRIAWAVVSTGGRYAIVSVVAQPHHEFQGGILLLRRTRHGWHAGAPLIDAPCDTVPRRVIRDFHTYFSRHPRYHVIYRAARSAPTCSGRLARGASVPAAPAA